MAGNFLQRSRHGTTYFFRRRVPADVQHILKLHQLYRSLATADRKEATIRARKFAARTDELFAQIRLMTKKKKGDTLNFGLIVAVDADELGLPRLKVQTEPHDTPQDKERAFQMAQEFAEARRREGGLVPAVKAGMPLKEAVEQFLANIHKPKTFRAYRTALNIRAIPFFGAERLTSEIDQELFAEYVKHIFSDSEAAHSTKVGYVNAFTSLFSWLRARHPKSTHILSTKKLIPNKSGSEAEERDSFTMSQLQSLFENAAKYRAAEPHKFWVTVATAFMGCRIEEIAQVHLLTDLLHDQSSDIWYLDFNDRPDPDGVKRKSIKKPTSKRVAPIHSALIRHGFLEYLQTQKEAGATRPFECGWKPWNEPKRGGVHWSHAISKWGGRELGNLAKAGNISREGSRLTYFHSMRHTLAQVLAERGVSEEWRAALQGQVAAGAGENATRYVKLRQDPKFLSDLIETNLTDYASILDDALGT
ncbi:MAG: DUF6538 domain-containing protein [Burkholderiales bacterium]